MSEPIRILQVIGSMNRGGAESMIMNLYRVIDRTKVQFDFVEHTVHKSSFDEEIKELGGRIYRCPSFKGKNYFSYRKWWLAFFKKYSNKYPIVHGHIGSTATIYLSVAKKYGCYCIAHSHNTNAKRNLNQFLYSCISYRTRYIADYFFACSEQAGRDRYGKKVVCGNSYSVFHNAIDTSIYKYDVSLREEVRNELKIADDEYVIGHVGRFMYQKNHEFLIKIFKSMIDLGINSKLLLVGDGELREKIERQISEYGLENKVIMTGVRSDVYRLYQAMDMMVFPSRFEGLPVTMVEAQSAGLPCVISNYVPGDCILVPKLVTIMELNKTEKEWAKHIITRMKEKRKDCREQVIKAGFDTSMTAKWLEEFYININEKK